MSQFERGWRLSMKRIDAEFDIPQFLTSLLVRKIAENDFCLSLTDRNGFPKLPDDVIARIVKIVRDSYFEAREDIGGKNFSEHLRRQAVAARREMIANGELISKDDFRLRLDVTERRLDKLSADGSVFAFRVDELEYFPALLVDPTRNQERRQEICRIILPAPPTSRLDFLTSKWSSLDDRSPLEMLDDDHDFRLLRKAAIAWAAEFSRTAVKIYNGNHLAEPEGVAPIYVAMAEIDVRLPLWKRALEALAFPGYQWPSGHISEFQQFSLFVSRLAAGHSEPKCEACVQVEEDGEYLRIHVIADNCSTLKTEMIERSESDDLIETAKQIIRHLSK
ncbi:hypothetical protein [Caballeronia sp. 15711]|uniref:hypothetical protein n=1 Tax=Caballeronia sp. 15711 TaxID=3391029 RepID=UPI0039E3BE5E